MPASQPDRREIAHYLLSQGVGRAPTAKTARAPSDSTADRCVSPRGLRTLLDVCVV
jgi:hypothetical protein